jgi:tetratricopeptide (TPR) repeat protein
MDDPQDLRANALALRNAQRMEEAYALIDKAAKVARKDAGIAFIRAQIALETGRPATALFDVAQRLDPENLMLARNRAAAYAGEDKVAAAQQLLEQKLRAKPDWLDGHKLLCSLRLTSGEQADFARSYSEACNRKPENLSLFLAWFHLQAMARNWEAARAIVADAVRVFGPRPALTYAQIFIASESGEAAKDATLFDDVADVRDPGLDLCQTRFWLRYGDAARAEAIASRNMSGLAAHVFWPYLSLIWRLTQNSKAQWLDQPAQYIRHYDLDFTPQELQHLAKILRKMHSMRAPFLEQSVRGGTQTDGQLFFNADPAIQAVRQKAVAAVATYVADMPATDLTHPLLGTKRDSILFEGSWSVRLAAQGFHNCHTHTHGWISSALYVSLPEPATMGPPPAGWLSFGTPPPELGLNLPDYMQVEPRPGRLVLFPSTMWHSTQPFNDGERLTIAFDVRRSAA